MAGGGGPLCEVVEALLIYCLCDYGESLLL